MWQCRRCSPALTIAFLTVLLAALTAPAARAAEKLLFCNTPERIRTPGTYADTRLKKGQTYRIFFHYRNSTSGTSPLVLSFKDAKGRPVTLDVRSGIGLPSSDPTLVGRQAMARYLSAPRKRFIAKDGSANIPITLRPKQVASGVMSVVADRDVRMRIYFRHDRWSVPGMKVVTIDASRRDMQVALTQKVKRQYRRIGLPEPGAETIYGLLYAFDVKAPKGSRVRITFSPRGGQAGLVGMLNGTLRQSPIIAAGWKTFAEAVVGPDGRLRLTTSPFGGVFYPVELAFELLK
jgi:hypothetical protein